MKRLLTATTILLAALSAQAQELGFWQKVNNLLTTVKGIDTAYIYQPRQGFTIGLFSTVQQVGFDTKGMFNVNYGDGSTAPGVTKYHLENNPSTKLGLELGYGKVVLGYGFELGPKKAYKKRALGLNLLGKNWGLHFNYFNISNTFKSNIHVEDEGGLHYMDEQLISPEPAMLNYFLIDGYYVFNNKRFAYPAAYKAGLVQRKTAGSWMVTGRFMQGSLRNTPEAGYDTYSLLDAFSTMQVSVGGGYSANIVCWHKNPAEFRDKGLRNLTVNLTVLPVLTAFNYLKTSLFEYNEDDEYIGDKVSRIYCYPMPNIVGSSAVSLTLDRFFISTQFTFNWFYFHSSQAFDRNALPELYALEDLTFRGSFHNWNLKLLFTYKF